MKSKNNPNLKICINCKREFTSQKDKLGGFVEACQICNNAVGRPWYILDLKILEKHIKAANYFKTLFLQSISKEKSETYPDPIYLAMIEAGFDKIQFISSSNDGGFFTDVAKIRGGSFNQGLSEFMFSPNATKLIKDFYYGILVEPTNIQIRYKHTIQKEQL